MFIMSAYSSPVTSSSVVSSSLPRHSEHQTEREERQGGNVRESPRSRVSRDLRLGEEHWSQAHEVVEKPYSGGAIDGFGGGLYNCNHGSKESTILLQAKSNDCVATNSRDRTNNQGRFSRGCKEHFCTKDDLKEDNGSEPGHRTITRGNWLGLSKKERSSNDEQYPPTTNNRCSRDPSPPRLWLHDGNEFSPDITEHAAWLFPHTSTQLALRHKHRDLVDTSRSMDLEAFRNKQISLKSENCDLRRDYTHFSSFRRAGETGTDRCEMYQSIFPVVNTNISRGLQDGFANVETREPDLQGLAGSNHCSRSQFPRSKNEKLVSRSASAIAVDRQGHWTPGRVSRSTTAKDRHSKVRTAKGLRDRRVRLSAATAVQFYDIQDRLGYDQPSKAVDWLMQKAKAAIDVLLEAPVVSECAANPCPSFTLCPSRGPTTSLGIEVASSVLADNEPEGVNSHNSLSQIMPFRTFIASKDEALVENNQEYKHNEEVSPQTTHALSQSQQGASNSSTSENTEGPELTVSSVYERQESRSTCKKKSKRASRVEESRG